MPVPVLMFQQCSKLTFEAGRRNAHGVSETRPPAGGPLARAWNEPSMMEFVETPVKDAAQFLSDFMAIKIDISGLPAESQAMRVTKNIRGVSWANAVALMLDDLSLRCEARGGDSIVILRQKAS